MIKTLDLRGLRQAHIRRMERRARIRSIIHIISCVALFVFGVLLFTSILACLLF